MNFIQPKVPLPENLHIYQSEAEEIYKNHLIKILEFSGPIYQIQVLQENQDNLVFLQIDDKGGLKDNFCSCSLEDTTSYCVHVAAALFQIYNNHSQPLHVRFSHSLWNHFCRIYFHRYGDKQEIFSKADGQYSIDSISGKNVFVIYGKTEEAKQNLKELFETKKIQTEETSLKFSNLSQEELSLWKEGRPSDELRYELSFWNDLAHLLMQLQEDQERYEIIFEKSTKAIPNYIKIKFPQIELGFYISEANWSDIIPSLSTVNSPLKAHQFSYDEIEKIIYNKSHEEFEIVYKNVEATHFQAPKEGYKVDGWTFVENDGFYPTYPDQLLEGGIVPKEKISFALTEHTDLFKGLLENTTIHADPITLSYSISFDQHWNLHIIAYAFNPGDLSHPNTKIYGNWLYLEDDGFYPLEESIFPRIETVIASEHVSDFVSNERSWLNTQEGFHTHLSSIEALLTYSLDSFNRLRFSRISAIKTPKESKDFGSWVYIAGQGFFAKISTATNLPVQSDISIAPDQIPLFIRLNRGELQLVVGFFSNICPIEKSFLQVTLEDDESINISPYFNFLPEYENKEVKCFDEFCYVEGEGFSELSARARLPERYRSPLHIDRDQLPDFLSYELNIIQQLPSQIDCRILPPTEIHLYASSITIDNDRGGYHVKLFYKTDLGNIPFIPIWKAIKEKKKFFFHENGRLDLENKRYDWIKILSKKSVSAKEHSIFFSTLEFIRINSLDPITIDPRSKHFQSSEGILKELTDFHVPEQPNIEGLVSHLRPYQLFGLHWLWFLYKHRLSGLLCDEMGLGKTHQAMALMAAIVNDNKKSEIPSHFLIICPTSVMYHWQEKLQQFLPGLRICIFHGTNRSLKSFHQEYDILITSYGIWRIEHELLSTVSFKLAILDEIQIAKNHNSRLHVSLRSINATMRVGLTGTPIENNLRELKALFDLAIPTYMPTDVDFKESFIKPIERENDPDKRALLTKFIKPFILRRKKKDVLLDLPEKIEEISHCELSFDQLLLYNQTLQRSRQQLIDQLQDAKTNVPYIHIFALLSSLKQICNHPAVFLKKPDNYKKYSSGKWDLFLELFSEARDSKQKIVIFTQYLAMLDIFESYLNELGIGFATIRGSTVNRGEQVNRFNKDPNCEVFLGSLQAAGLGVDLTAGSVVIHYDRWWNAAREDQATDRVHRIGQTRGVQVFKLVTKSTFEERIDIMIARKGKLMEDVVSADDHRFIKIFNRKELIELLQDVHLD